MSKKLGKDAFDEQVDSTFCVTVKRWLTIYSTDMGICLTSNRFQIVYRRWITKKPLVRGMLIYQTREGSVVEISSIIYGYPRKRLGMPALFSSLLTLSKNARFTRSTSLVHLGR